jgi:general secretion pathway protein G
MEILIVLAIMGVIATLVAPRLFNQLDKSKVTVAETQIAQLRSALDTMRFDIGRYPTDDEGLRLLTQRPEDPSIAAVWSGPYLDGEVLPSDPWGNPYRYRLPEADDFGFEVRPIIFTYGADNQPGGTGINADIGPRGASLPVNE